MPHTQAAFDLLESFIPDFKKLNPESLLYIGIRNDTKRWWYDFFCRQTLNIKKVAVLEIFPPNFAALEEKIWEGRYDLKPILGDVREIEKHISEKEYDIIFFDHGCEHLDFKDLNPTTEKLKRFANKLLIYSCPWGDWPQGVEDNNEFEIHRTQISIEMLEDLGMEVYTTGTTGQVGLGEIIAFHESK